MLNKLYLIYPFLFFILGLNQILENVIYYFINKIPILKTLLEFQIKFQINELILLNGENIKDNNITLNVSFLKV